MIKTEQRNLINEKKSDEEGTTKEKADWPGFFKSLSAGVLMSVCVGVILVGSIGLYTAKVAHANILPDNIDLQPYTNIERIVKETPIYMNPLKIRSFYGLNFLSDPEELYSQIAKFNSKDFLNTFSDSWLCNIEEWAKPGRFLSKFWLFESNVLKPMIANTFGLMNNIFYKMNYLPEWLFMLLYSILFTIIFLVLYIYNIFTGIFLHLTNLYQYFLQPDVNDEGKWNKEQPAYFNIKNMVLFYFMWITVSFLSVLFSPFFVTIYCLLAPLSATYKLANSDKVSPNSNTVHTFMSFMKDTVTYKNTFILLLIMFQLIRATNSYLGSSYLSGVIIAILILIFGLKIFDTTKPTDDTTEILLKKLSLPNLSKQPISERGNENPEFCKKKEEQGENEGNEENVDQYFVGGMKTMTENKGKIRIKKYNVKLV
jgi:hypothetical protein